MCKFVYISGWVCLCSYRKSYELGFDEEYDGEKRIDFQVGNFKVFRIMLWLIISWIQSCLQITYKWYQLSKCWVMCPHCHSYTELACCCQCWRLLKCCFWLIDTKEIKWQIECWVTWIAKTFKIAFS